MGQFVQSIRTRRQISRTRRLINLAIENASTPSMRDELIVVAQRQLHV